MLRITCLATMLVLVGGDIANAAVSTRSAERAATFSARARGYTAAQTACFVPLFVRYARQDRNGRWVAGSRTRSGDAYRHEALTRCGVTR